jgi:hypothetical protein
MMRGFALPTEPESSGPSSAALGVSDDNMIISTTFARWALAHWSDEYRPSVVGAGWMHHP